MSAPADPIAPSAVPTTAPALAPTLSIEQAKEALELILDELENEDVMERIDAAREIAGADVEQIMVHVVPLLFEIQGTVMQDYEFEASDLGFEQFASALKGHESEGDADFNDLSKKLKAAMKKATTPVRH